MQACQSIGLELSKPTEWVDGCVKEDAVYIAAYEEKFMQLPANEVCLATVGNPSMPTVDLGMRTAKKRKINCEKVFSEYAPQVVSQMNSPDLCNAIHFNTLGVNLKKYINTEVKNRGLDCQKLAIAQIQVEQQIAREKELQAAKSRAQAGQALAAFLGAAAMSAQQRPIYAPPPTISMPALSNSNTIRNTTTSCNTWGGTLNCNSTSY